MTLLNSKSRDFCCSIFIPLQSRVWRVVMFISLAHHRSGKSMKYGWLWLIVHCPKVAPIWKYTKRRLTRYSWKFWTCDPCRSWNHHYPNFLIYLYRSHSCTFYIISHFFSNRVQKACLFLCHFLLLLFVQPPFLLENRYLTLTIHHFLLKDILGTFWRMILRLRYKYVKKAGYMKSALLKSLWSSASSLTSFRMESRKLVCWASIFCCCCSYILRFS